MLPRVDASRRPKTWPLVYAMKYGVANLPASCYDWLMSKLASRP